ncbi:MAG: fibronectin type III domain-containing protein [Nitrospirae bacterium]|nr:fibronectin type III domain-containing protein [Nitrospirota bacterium]
MIRGWRPGIFLSVLMLWGVSGCGPVGGDLPETNSGDAPIMKEVRPLTVSSIRLEWEDRSQGEEGFGIERRTAQDIFRFRAQVGPDETVFEDTGLAAETTYYYRVYYIKGDEQSKYSNELQGSTFATP